MAKPCKDNLKLQWEMFDLDKIIFKKCSRTKQNRMPILIGMWKSPKVFKVPK